MTQSSTPESTGRLLGKSALVTGAAAGIGRATAELFAREYKRVSAHTNFEMASVSLSGSVRQMEEIFDTDLQQSKAYTLKEFEARGWWERVCETVVAPFRSQM